MKKFILKLIYFFSVLILAFGFFYGYGNFFRLSTSVNEAFSLSVFIAAAFAFFSELFNKKAINK